VIRHRDRLLVTSGIDAGNEYYRCVGGGIELGERAEQAVRRELREELDVELSRAELLGVIENLFDFEGRPHHEIVFAFDCVVADPAFYDRGVHDVVEHGTVIEQARWVALADFSSGKRLVPDGLLQLIRQSSAYQSA
jgi:ADP-ribose pyrophosphatase YjhB (NUDIX family)